MLLCWKACTAGRLSHTGAGRGPEPVFSERKGQEWSSEQCTTLVLRAEPAWPVSKILKAQGGCSKGVYVDSGKTWLQAVLKSM